MNRVATARRYGHRVGDDALSVMGQYIRFPQTAAARIAASDPRPPVQERCGNFSAYYYRLKNAIEKMVAQRMLLPPDSGTVFNAGVQRGLNAGLTPTPDEAAGFGLGAFTLTQVAHLAGAETRLWKKIAAGAVRDAIVRARRFLSADAGFQPSCAALFLRGGHRLGGRQRRCAIDRVPLSGILIRTALTQANACARARRPS